VFKVSSTIILLFQFHETIFLFGGQNINRYNFCPAAYSCYTWAITVSVFELVIKITLGFILFFFILKASIFPIN